ncbi:hypothetical protein Egran_00760 [Elaphomyces granulatus]|uniref:Mitochondrial intermediate peptidase n=1 Tax=Elaphomyces granulatus TaxID=519963 RepID=A0A232M5D4_9EURO|nr:hypothetical protein Egran_00760 [Elaphomyces granulatus]
MLRQLLRPRRWTCQHCLQRRERLDRLFLLRCFETAASHPPSFTPPSSYDDAITSTREAIKRRDDDLLRRVFDSRTCWHEFSQSSRRTKRVGLVQNRYLTSPQGFRDWAHVSRQKCQRIVSRVLAASTVEEYRSIARDLDRLSDLLCRVIDLADFTRTIHPDPSIQEAAAQAYTLLFEYMNVLNTTTGLYDQLQIAVDHPQVTVHWTDGEKRVAHILRKDFLDSAIHLSPAARQRFVALSNEISQSGADFVHGAEPARSHVLLRRENLRGLDPNVLRQLPGRTRVALPTVGRLPTLALQSVHDEAARREIYLASRTASPPQIGRLERLLRQRAELARLVGYPSYAHMALSGKMAETPEAVSHFLTSLLARNRGPVQEELSQMQQMKADGWTDGTPPMDPSPRPAAAPLQPWDHAYGVDRRVRTDYRLRPSPRELGRVSEFFSLGTVMQGLSRLWDRLYGVRLVPRETDPGETWHPDVRRLDVVDEADRPVAVLYCDLLTRPDKKSSHPAHFTLRCAREISAEEIAEAAATEEDDHHPSAHPNDGMATAMHPETNTLRQLPTIALVCDFPERPVPARARTQRWGWGWSGIVTTAEDGNEGNEGEDGEDGAPPSLLTEHHLRTLFHEMGHAVHSVLGQTPFQSISGTRCATDLAELPSVIMENFATAPAVLGLYARHWQTNEPLSARMMRGLERDRSLQGAVDGAFRNEIQILMALVDQAYHTLSPEDAVAVDSTALYHRLLAAHASLPDPTDTQPPTSWPGFFQHLYGYGATYYSYLFDRALADRIWQDVFGAGQASLDRSAGERFKDEVLRWGGGRNGWRCVAGVLGSSHPSNADGRLVEGGEAAMREVGRWGIGRDAVT